MSYASRDDILARAGRLQDAWDETTQPSLGDLDLFLAQSAAEIDAWIGSRGFPVPVTDPTAAAALVSVNADKALLLALRATWPGGSGPDAVSDLIRDVEARVTAYDAAIAAGNLPALLLLSSTAAAGQEGGASDFWTEEGAEYEYWSRLTAWFPQSWITDPWGIPSSQQPEFRRGERF
jgi:hypothetical protein